MHANKAFQELYTFHQKRYKNCLLLTRSGIHTVFKRTNYKTLIFNDKNEDLGEFFAYDSEMQ